MTFHGITDFSFKTLLSKISSIFKNNIGIYMEVKYQIDNPQFKNFIIPSAQLEQLYTGTRWAEGPAYFGDGQYIVWSDIPNNRMMRWTEDSGVGVFRQPSNFSNGNTRDRQGRLITCEHGLRRVTRTELNGSITVIADSYLGKRLNSPNDVVVKSDDSIWFTDPPYGILSNHEGTKADSEQESNFVFRWDPKSKELEVVADDFVKPNGLAFSPDESILYVSDTGRSHDPDGPHHIRAFDVKNGTKLVNGRLFAETDVGLPDGFRIDTDGNIWTSAGDGVHCFSPKGELLGKILIPEVVSNCTFGGINNNRLFITATTSLYAIYLNRRGVQVP